MAKFNFTIFNRDFEISASDFSEDQLKNLVNNFTDRVNKLKESYNIDDPIRLLVFLSLNLLNENIEMKKIKIQMDVLKPSTKTLIKKIEEVLNND